MDDAAAGLMSAIPAAMAQKLLRLRDLRAAQARKAALLRTQEARNAWGSVAESRAALERHREHWSAVEAEDAARMNDPSAHEALNPQTLRDMRDHLNGLADRAVALQQVMDLRASEARTCDAAAALAWGAHRELDERCGHARRLLDGARAAERREQEALEEQELEDLALMRHAGRGAGQL